MPRLIRLYIDSVLLGFVIGILFMVLLVLFDIAGIGSLVLRTQGGFIAVAMVTVFFGTLFASVQFALSVMRLAEVPDRPRRRNR